MTDRKPMTEAEREARKAFKDTDAPATLSEHQLREKTFNENRERLKRERLEREARPKEP
jgi:hypothetical protein